MAGWSSWQFASIVSLCLLAHSWAAPQQDVNGLSTTIFQNFTLPQNGSSVASGQDSLSSMDEFRCKATTTTRLLPSYGLYLNAISVMAETAKADYREDLEPDTNLYRDVNITSSGYPEGNDVSALNLLKSLASIIRFYVEQTRYLTAVFLCLDNNKRVSWVYFDEDRNTIGASNQTQNTTSTLSRRQSTNNSVSLSATQLKTDSINARPRIQFKTEFYGPEVRQEYYFEAIAGLLLECGPYAKTNPLTEDFHEETVHEVAVRVTRNVARSHAPAVLTSEDVIDMLKIAAEEATQQAEGGAFSPGNFKGVEVSAYYTVGPMTEIWLGELEIENVDEGKGKGNGVDAAVASKGVAVPSSVVETS